MEELGRRLAEGDERAFAELYDAMADRLHNYLAQRLGNVHEADDALQETFLRLVRTRANLGTVANLAAYVFTTARNEAARFGSRKARENQRHSHLGGAALNLPAAAEKSRENEEAISTALRGLGDEHREVVELKVYGGLTFREIGEVLGVPLQTAATRYRAALDRLKHRLARLH